MKRNTKIKLFVTAVLIFLATIYGASCVSFVPPVKLTVYNANPYPIQIFTKVQASPGKWVEDGFRTLQPAEKFTYEIQFSGIEPKFYVYGVSHSEAAEMIDFLNELSGDELPEVVFSGSEDDATSLVFEVSKDKKLIYDSQSDKTGEPVPVPVETEEVIFATARMSENNQEASFIASDPIFQQSLFNKFTLGGKGNEEEFYAEHKKNILSLEAAIKRQMAFHKSFPDPERNYPFQPEFEIVDENGPLQGGVLIKNVDKETIFGDENLLEDGDILISISGSDGITEIYSAECVYQAIYAHGMTQETGGIKNPLSYVVIRHDQVLEINSYYLFNPYYSKYQKTNPLVAACFGALNSWSLGFFPTVAAFFQWLFTMGEKVFSNTKWEILQYITMLSQLHPQAFSWGEIVGFIAPSPVQIFVLGKIGGKGVLGMLTSVAINSAVEVGEIAIYEYNQAPPTRSNEQLLSNIKTYVPYIAAFSIAGGVLRSGVLPSLSTTRSGFGIPRRRTLS